MIESQIVPGTIIQDDDTEEECITSPLDNNINGIGYLPIIGGWDGTDMDITLHGHDTYTPIIGGWGIEEDESSTIPDHIAQLATGREQPSNLEDNYSRIRNNPSWHDLLDITHDEHHDIRNY